MVKGARRHQALCPAVQRAFELLSRKWTGLIIRELAGGRRYFCDFQKGIPAVSARLLAQRIRELEKEGIVIRTVHTSSPIRVVYELSAKGRALVPAIDGIETWARKWPRGDRAS